MSSASHPGRRSALCLMALVCSGLAMSGRASGQGYETFASERASIVSRSRLRLGPLYIIPGIRLGLEHDNNIYGASESRGPVQDYTAGLGVSGAAHWLARDWLTLSASYAPSYDYYFRMESERAFNHAASLGARLLLFNRFPISGGYQNSKSKARLSSEVDRRVFQESKGYYTGINFDTPGNSSVGVVLSRTKFSFEELTLPGSQVPLSQALDRTENNARLNFYLPVFIDSQFYANFGFTDYVFEDTAGGFRDSSSYQSYFGVRFPILGRARGNVTIGYKKFTPVDARQPGFSGIVGNTDVELRLGRINLRALYMRDIPFSYGGSIFFVNSSYGGGLSAYIGQIMRIDYDYSRGGGDYPGAQEVSVPGGVQEFIQRNDTYQSHSVGIVFRILNVAGIGVSASTSERNSNYVLENMSRTSFGMYLTYDF